MGAFDRIVVVNLDRRPDRLARFSTRADRIESLAGWERLRAVDGEAVPAPPFFRSGYGAYGCRQSHLRALEDALMDGIGSLLVLEDDCRFCEDFDERLADFLNAVPTDWCGLWLGGHHDETTDRVCPGVVRCRSAGRTHAYAVRGREAMRALYRLWARSDRHIDHIVGEWQSKWPVYAPDPMLCGQDSGRSDISGHADGVRFWAGAPIDAPLYLLDVPKDVADQLWRLGAFWGDDRDPRTGRSAALTRLESGGWSLADCRRWADGLVGACHLTPDIPCVWPSPVGANFGRRAIIVRADTAEEAAAQIPGMLPRLRADRVTWLWRGDPGRYSFDGWTVGRRGTREWLGRVVASGRYAELPRVVAQLRKEAGWTRGGPVVVAHDDLDVDKAMAHLPEAAELVGGPADWDDCLLAAGRA